MKSRRNKPLVKYDQASDALYLMMREGEEDEFREVFPGVNIEMDAQGEVLGVEILRASRILGNVLDSLYRKKHAA